MSDPAPAARAGEADRGGPLTPERVEAVLADFRAWLTALPADAVPPAAPPPAVDLASVVAQVTALRHEVNLQTKAARAATEQTAEALKLASAPKPAADPDEAVRPLVKALLDIADALAIGLRQAESARAAAEELMHQADPETVPAASVGFWGRLLGRGPNGEPEPAAEPDADEDKLLRLLAGLADGYALSLRRVERALPAAGLEPIACVGRPFDPELMEVVEVIEGDDYSAGTVVAEVRRGYRRNGKPYRFAQVKVAR